MMRLRPGLNHNFTVMGHAHICQRLFHLDVHRDGSAERTGKAAKAGKVIKGPLIGLPAGVVPLTLASPHSPPRYPDPSPADREDNDTVIEEVARDAEAEAAKITAEEAAKGAAEDAAKGPAGETGKAASEEAKSSMAAIDKAEVDLEERVTETQAWFRRACEELKTAHDLLAERKQELVLKQADIEKAQEAAKEQAAKDEVERDGLKKHVLELTEERDAAKGALADAQATVLGKVELLSKANDSIRDLKLKLEGLEGTLLEVRAREETLTKDLEAERQLRRTDAANLEDFVKGKNLWISRLADIADRITTQLATMGMPNMRPSSSANPLFKEQGVDPGYVTKNHFFIAQRALHQESEELGERLEQLASDLRQSETRNRDYIDDKFPTQMEELRNMIVRRPSSSSSSSRRHHSSR
nr:translation initiation factor IF-2-like [Aegilops tauschii subsp. strangulata]